MDKERKSNFELLRIISIVLILFHHLAYHNELYFLANDNINKYIGIFLFTFGKIGVNLFVLISGYFMINQSLKLKKLFMLWLQIFIYSAGIMLIMTCLKIYNPTGIFDVLKYFLPISYNIYWFATAYIGMYLFTPFINSLLNPKVHIKGNMRYSELFV